MSKYDRDAIEIYILDHIDTDNYGKDDDEIYILYKRIIREVFFKMCEDMKVC